MTSNTSCANFLIIVNVKVIRFYDATHKYLHTIVLQIEKKKVHSGVRNMITEFMESEVNSPTGINGESLAFRPSFPVEDSSSYS